MHVHQFTLVTDGKERKCIVKKTVIQPYGYQGGKGGSDKLGDWERHIQTTIYKIDD